jgi:hypothetical protein
VIDHSLRLTLEWAASESGTEAIVRRKPPELDKVITRQIAKPGPWKIEGDVERADLFTDAGEAIPGVWAEREVTTRFQAVPR